MKKLIITFIFFFLFQSNNLFAQQQWLNINPVIATDSIAYPLSITFDNLNKPWIVSTDDFNMAMAKTFTKSSSSWSCVDSSLTGWPICAIDNSGVIYASGFSGIINTYNTVNGDTLSFSLGGTYQYEQVFVNPVNNDKWFSSSYSSREWVKLNSTDTIHYTLTSLGLPGNSYFVTGASFNSNGDFIFASYDTTGHSQLLKFDGTQWLHYDFTNYGMPVGVYPEALTLDKYDNIWMSAYADSVSDNSLVKFDWNSIIVYYDNSCIGCGYVSSNIEADNLGNIWGFNQGQIVKFDGTSFVYFTPPFDLEYSMIVIDYQDNLWFYYQTLNNQQTGVTIFNEAGFKTLSGNVYDDVNSNGIRDLGEAGLPNENVLSSTLLNYCKTDANGNYNLAFLDSSQSCQINHQLKPYRTHTSTPTTYNITPSINGTTGFDFGVYATPGINDMSIYTSPAIARPGFDCSYNINWNNPGTITQTDTITFTYDPALTYLNATPTPLSVNGNILKWKFTNAQPLDNGSMSVHFNVPATVPIGDTLNCLAAIGNVSIDSTPADNAWASQTIVTGSFDPNEKIAEPSQFAVAGQWLYYTIYFQNTGTDTAFTVVVRDTLDANLNIASFEMLGSSHPCFTELSGFGFVKFTFNNILLPDSNVNETMSHGYVTYRVRAAANVAIGTPINNTAYIYFDFNSPVVTNTTLNTVHNPLAVKEVLVKNDFALIPNPASNYITINATGIKLPYAVEITDATARVLNKVNVTAKQQRINTSNLVNGVYFVTVKNEQAGFTKKMVVQK